MADLDGLKKLGNICLKRYEIIWGIIIISIVMQPYWFTRFVKVADIYFFIHAGNISE